jgi:hypothetical protein
MLLKYSSFSTAYKSSVSTCFAEHVMPILHILCYISSLVTWTLVSSTIAKFKPLIFSVSGFTLSYTTNMFILMILYDFCLLPAEFCCIIIYIQKVESCVHLCTLESFQWCTEPYVLEALASVISVCSPHVILLSKITPRYFMFDKGDIPSIKCKMNLRGTKSMRKLGGLSLSSLSFVFHCLHHVSIALRPHFSFLRT